MNQMEEAIQFALKHVKIKREDIFYEETSRKKFAVHAKKLIIILHTYFDSFTLIFMLRHRRV